MRDRKDLSEWTIHFVHQRNPENDPLQMYGERYRYPIAFQDDGEPVFTHCAEMDDTSPLAPDAAAINVLSKIVDDGYIRAGWAFRNGRPTIYGPRAAVCFTEMPLYALINYAKTRSDEQNVDTFGIALPKAELFQAGARPVIYGLSGNHKELRYAKGEWTEPRLLDPSCGIGPKEQYRYVAMSLGGPNRIDWSHEREWRWTTDFPADSDAPGLGIWSDCCVSFSQIILLVPKEKQAKRLLDQLKAYDDHPYNRVSFEVNRQAVHRTKVLALDLVADQFREDPTTRLEDLPALSLQKYVKPVPTRATISKVQAAVVKAREAAVAGAWTRDGGCFGFAWVVTFEAQSEVTQALVDLKYAKVIDGAYVVSEVMKDVHSSMIDTLEAAGRAAAEVLTKELGQPFYMSSMLD